MRRFASPGWVYVLLLPVWLVTVADLLWFRNVETYLFSWLATLIHCTVFSATAAAATVYVLTQWRRGPFARCVALTAAYMPVWHWSMYVGQKLHLGIIVDFLYQFGLCVLFVTGLAWLVWYLEQCAEDYRRREFALGLSPDQSRKRVWDPRNPKAWYYFRERKLNQSATAFSVYSLAFALALFLFNYLQGCDRYELPGGGGGGGAPKASQAQKMQVQIKKVIRKKFLINPFSLVKFNPPPIDEVKLNLAQATEHMYKVGYGSGGSGFGDGDGEGSGFGGPDTGKIRFIRLEYAGGDWDQDFGVGADLNMLIQYGVLTSTPSKRMSEKTESIPIVRLASFPRLASPPMLYLTGQRSISLSASEVKLLRDYLLERHGMIFGDNGGSAHFHSQFFSAMRQVLPEVEPVRVPLDDIIHRAPFPLPFMPYVAPHGGREAWGWKVDGRWVVYYHPGDIGDAWADGHSNVPKDVYEACYQLGANIIFYSHLEQAKWRRSQKIK